MLPKNLNLTVRYGTCHPKQLGNYTKQLRYLENYLSSEFSVLNIEAVKPAHIKSYMAKMDDAGRKPQYINDLLKVFKTFFTYLEPEGYIKVVSYYFMISSPGKNFSGSLTPSVTITLFK